MKTIFTLILCTFLGLHLAAQCTAHAGSPQSLQFDLCTGEFFNVSATDIVLTTSGDSLVFVVHDGGPTTLGNVLAVQSSADASSATGSFTWSAAYQPGVTYQITAFAAQVNSLPPISIDLSDPCLSISPVGTVTYHPLPTVDAGPSFLFLLNCLQTQAVIQATGSEGPEFSYAWSAPNGGSIVSGANTLNPTIDQAGTYCVTVTNTQTGCTATDCTAVVEDTALPLANVGSDLILICNQITTIGGVGSTGPEFTYGWTTNDGNIIADQNTLIPLINAPGTYCLTVTNTMTGCTNTDCMTFLGDPIPAITITGDLTLDCESPSIELTGNITPPPGNFEYEWMGPNGFNQAGNDPLTVNMPGTYCMVVINTANSCIYETCVTVMGAPPMPFPSVVPGALLCEAGSTWLSMNNYVDPNNLNYIYSWSTSNGNIVSGQDSVSVEVNQPGMYCVTVTDVITGCTTTDCDTVYAKPHLSLQVPAIICPNFTTDIGIRVDRPLPDMLDFLLYVEVDGDLTVNGVLHNSLLYYLTPAISGPLHIKAWVTNLAGNCISDTLEQIISPALPLNYTVVEDGCHAVEITVSVVPTGISNFNFAWADPFGNVISTTPTAFITETTWYYLTINNGACVWMDSVFVPVNFMGNCASIEGSIRRNLAEDCLLSPGDPPLAGWLVQAVGVDTFYATTNASGQYVMPVDPGSYTVSVVPTSAFWQPCGNDFSVNLPTPDDTASVDFLVKKLPGCPELTVDISTPLLRRCFSSNYSVSYCNHGVEDATDAYVVVDFDDFIDFNSAIVPYTDLGNNQYQFNIGNVTAGECDNFWISVTVSCDAVLGQTHCTEAHIYPDSTCLPPDPLWSGASLQLTAECTDSLRFTVTNVGTAPMSAALDFVVIEDAVMYMQTPPPGPTLGIGQSFELTVPANGATWRMEAEQELYHPVAALPVAVVEGCGTDFSTGFVNQFSLGDEAPFLDVDCTQNVGSYDPNDKQGFPTGYGEAHQVLPGTELQYLIRFQNTGTDTAFTVIVRDTLSPWLDVASVRPGTSSHDYDFEIYAEGVLKFTFPNILLPDSSTNQAGSNGFVQFSARPRAEALLQTVIENTAAIYFDFNEPVLTNAVFHTIDTGFITVPTPATFVPSGLAVQVSPNPFDGALRVQLTGVRVGNSLIFKLLDVTGQCRFSQKIHSPGAVLEVPGLPAGLYFFKIEAAGGGVVAAGKVVRGD